MLFTETKSEPLQLRYYQQEAIQAAYDHLRNRKDNPCIVLPTGAGKTPVLATICHDAVKRWGGRVLVLSHVKELVSQAVETLGNWHPDLNVGAYSAGLKRRDTKSDVLVAGIQSVHKRGLQLAGSRPFNIVLVDEAHRIPTSGDGMYRNLLTDLQIASPSVRVIGLTATPYRLKGGSVCGRDNFLNAICYEAGVKELIAKGYLARLVSKEGVAAIDTSGIGVRNGEYKSEDLSAAFDDDSVVEMACAEIVAYAADRKSVLLFCCDVAHADHVSTVIANLTGERCGLVTGDTPADERDRTLEAFKNGTLKYLANVNVLTEGFDARRVDLVALLRSTLSPSLYYQMVGRGLRTHPGKQDCLVLDYGGNVETHGCIDAMRIKAKSSGGGGGEPPAWVCPECREIVPIQFDSCTACDYEFPERESESGPNHEREAGETPILSDQVKPVRWEVSHVKYGEHVKRNADEDAPRTLRVTYYDGLRAICDEWVCIEHGGWPGDKANDWWSQRTNVDKPATSEEAARLGNLGYLAEPTTIDIIKRPGTRFQEIVRYELGEMPDPDCVMTEIDEWGQEVRATFDDIDTPF